MRFFYQDDGEKVSTKCIRVSSTATTSDVMATLVEKFRPDLRMLSRAQYALYEVHVNGGAECNFLQHSLFKFINKLKVYWLSSLYRFSEKA